MILQSLPEAKFVHVARPGESVFTIGKDYPVVRPLGENGVVVVNDKGDEAVILKERLQ